MLTSNFDDTIEFIETIETETSDEPKTKGQFLVLSVNQPVS